MKNNLYGRFIPSYQINANIYAFKKLFKKRSLNERSYFIAKKIDFIADLKQIVL